MKIIHISRYCRYVLGFFLFHPIMASAQNHDAIQGNQRDESSKGGDAAVHFKQGVEFYKDNRFEQAAIEFARAYELKPSFRILFNIAQAENMLHHYAAAYDAYGSYLAEGNDEIPKARRDEVKTEIKRLLPKIGRFKIQCNRKGAKVFIDGEARGKAPFSDPILVDVGRHEVEVLEQNNRVLYRVFRIAGGQTISINADADAETDTETNTGSGSAVGETVSESDDAGSDMDTSKAPPKKRRLKLPAFIAVGVAASAAVGAAATGVLTLKKKGEVESGCKDHRCDKATWSDTFDSVKRFSLITDVLIGVAAVSATTATVLFILNAKREHAEPVALVPVPTSTGGTLILQGRF